MIGEVSFVTSEVLAYAIAIAAVVLAAITLYITRRRDEETGKLPEVHEPSSVLSLKEERTVTSSDAQKSKKELRLLDVEQEILSYGIRRLYEAQAEGKLNEKEREQLAEGYKQRMLEIKNAINKNESVVTLHELEGMQEDLIKLFNDRFDEINKKISGLKVNLGVKPEPAVPTIEPEEPSTISLPERTARRQRRRLKPKKTEAEERIDQIRSEVEKVLERLGQMETEA